MSTSTSSPKRSNEKADSPASTASTTIPNNRFGILSLPEALQIPPTVSQGKGSDSFMRRLSEDMTTHKDDFNPFV